MEAARILDISHLLDRKPKPFPSASGSGLPWSRAIVREPKVFLLDEPLSNLDAKLRAQMRTELSSFTSGWAPPSSMSPMTRWEAMTMGDRIVVMKDGFVQQVDTPRICMNPLQHSL